MNTDIFKCCSCPPEYDDNPRDIYIVIDVNSKMYLANYFKGNWRIKGVNEYITLNSWCYADEYYQNRLANLLTDLKGFKDCISLDDVKDLVNKYTDLIIVNRG